MVSRHGRQVWHARSPGLAEVPGDNTRYSKGSVGDHRSRGSNQLLRGARLVRYLRGGCLQRYTGTRVTEQTRPQPPPPVLRVSPR